MKRASITMLTVVVTAVATIATVTTASGSSRPTPILSPAHKPLYSKGFGKVKPTEIYFGGDGSGLVCRIHWTSWGRQFALGTGTSWYINSHQLTYQGHWARAVVVLYHLGTWHGRPAYKRLTWYFPQEGSTYGGVSRCRS